MSIEQNNSSKNGHEPSPPYYSRIMSAAGTVLSAAALISLFSRGLSIGLNGFVLETITSYRKLVDPIFDNTIVVIFKYFDIYFPLYLKDTLILYFIGIAIFFRWVNKVKTSSADAQTVFLIVVFYPFYLIYAGWSTVVIRKKFDEEDRRVFELLLSEAILVLAIVIVALLINQADMA